MCGLRQEQVAGNEPVDSVKKTGNALTSAGNAAC